MLKPSRNKYSIVEMLHLTLALQHLLMVEEVQAQTLMLIVYGRIFFMKQELFGNRNNISHAANNYPNTPHISRYSRTPHVLLVPCNDG